MAVLLCIIRQGGTTYPLSVPFNTMYKNESVARGSHSNEVGNTARWTASKHHLNCDLRRRTMA